jgi:hypothetical protein
MFVCIYMLQCDVVYLYRNLDEEAIQLFFGHFDYLFPHFCETGRAVSVFT